MFPEEWIGPYEIQGGKRIAARRFYNGRWFEITADSLGTLNARVAGWDRTHPAVEAPAPRRPRRTPVVSQERTIIPEPGAPTASGLSLPLVLSAAALVVATVEPLLWWRFL